MIIADRHITVIYVKYNRISEISMILFAIMSMGYKLISAKVYEAAFALGDLMKTDDRSGSGQNLYERGRPDQMSAVTPVIILTPTY